MGQSKKKMDWEPYLEDIVKFYVTDNKTVSQTISYLHDKYGLDITEQRFKRNFPGLKNLKATEWKDGIIPTIRKRSSEGKESDVYFNGEKLGYKRVKTAADRYSSQVNEEAVGTSEVVGQSINDRIFICTPSSLLCSPPQQQVGSEEEISRPAQIHPIPNYDNPSDAQLSSPQSMIVGDSQRPSSADDDGLGKLAPRYRDLVLTPNETTIEKIISAAAIDVESLRMFISGKNGVSIPERFKSTLEESLVVALRRGMMRAVTNLLQYGVDPNGPHLPRNDTKPLKAAIDGDSYEDYLDLLIRFKVNVNDKDVISQPPFDFKEVDHSLHVLKRMVTAGLDLQRYGPQMLERAAYRGYATNDIVRFLVDNGAPINYYGLEATVFQMAAFKGNLDLMKYLVDKGADCEKPAYGASGFTALQGAAASNDMETVQYLVDTLKVNINAAPAILRGVTALEASVRPRNGFSSYYWKEVLSDDDDSDEDAANTFTFLLGKGAEVNRVDGSPSPLLHDLIERRLIDLLRLVLEKGAQFEHLQGTDSSLEAERTPIQLACETLQLDAVKQLLDFGANLNAPPARGDGTTALQAAVSASTPDIELVKFLLSKGANVNAQVAPIGGITALQGAAIKGHINIVSLLIEEGADVNAASYSGSTAIDGAAKHGRLDVVQMLLNAGASPSGFKNAINLARGNRHFEIVKLLEERESG